MKYLLCALVVGLSLCAGSCEKNKFNKVIDEILYEAEQQMINKSQTVLKLPTISQKFTRKILFFNVHGSLDLVGASVRNLSTIYRIGDVVPFENDTDSTTSFEGTFGMKDLTVEADMLDFQVSIVHIHDPIRVTVGDNAASFKVTTSFDENFNCKATLNYAKVSRLGKFGISLGSGLLTGMEDELAGFIMNRLAPTVQDSINAHIFPMVEKAVSKLDLCGKLF